MSEQNHSREPDDGHLSTKSTKLQIEAADVIRLILQFLKENNLSRSLEALSAETLVPITTVQDASALVASIMEGRWDLVMEALAFVSLPDEIKASIYEQIFYELLEQGELDTARAILAASNALGTAAFDKSLSAPSASSSLDPKRYSKMEQALEQATLASLAIVKNISNDVVDTEDAPSVVIDTLGSKPDDKDSDRLYCEKLLAKRTKLAQLVGQKIQNVPAGRLLSLLGEALCYEMGQSLIQIPSVADGNNIPCAFDIFRGIVPVGTVQMDRPTTECYRVINDQGNRVDSAMIDIDGESLILGRSDGFVEIWSPTLGTLRLDLPYQKNPIDQIVVESSVTALSQSNSTTIAGGTMDGQIYIWDLVTGKTVKKIATQTLGVSSLMITSLAFSPDQQFIVSANSLDHSSQSLNSIADKAQGSLGNVQVWSVKTGALVRILQDPSRQAQFTVNGLEVTRAGTALHIIGVCSDGKVRVWKVSTNPSSSVPISCKSFMPPSSTTLLSPAPLVSIKPVPLLPDNFIISSRAGGSHLFNARGIFTTHYPSLSFPIAISHTGKWIYGIGHDGTATKSSLLDGTKFLQCVSLQTGTVEREWEHGHGSEIFHLLCHPHLAILYSISLDGKLKLWKHEQSCS